MSSTGEPKSVLIVEDEKIVAIEVRNHVESLGYAVAKVVSSGEAALDVADRYSFDLVLMDVELAGKLDGFETAKELRKRQDAPVIFLTGHTDNRFVVSAKEVGAFGYVVKPPRGRELAIGMELALYKHEGEKRLERERDRAERAMAAKSEFLANMSHELRTPLNSILGMADLALERATDSEQRSYLSILRSSGDALMALINGILDLSKIESGAMQLAEEPFDPLEVLEGSVEGIAIQGHKKGLDVDFYADPKLPARIVGDAGKLRQVLLNLLANAVKYTETGSVSCTASVKNGTLRIIVADTGVGIPQEFREQIFAPFYQIDQTSTKRHPGTGIGLTITKQLITMMGGSISFESALGKGSAFEIEVPIRLPPGEPAINSAESIREPESLGKLVLGVGRDTQRLLAVDWLRSWGIELAEVPAPVTPETLGEYKGDTAILVDEASAAGLGDHPTAWVLRRFDHRGARESDGRTLFEPLTVTKLRGIISGRLEPSDAPEPVAADLLEAAPRRVLLADDNAINRIANGRLIESLGYRVITVEDGQEALEALAKEVPDLIVLDLEMPRLDGYGAAKRITSGDEGSKAARVPLVALSAHTSQEARFRAFCNGFSAFLVKPFSRSALEHTLANAMDPKWRAQNLNRRFLEETRARFAAADWGELEAAAHCGRCALKELDPESSNAFLRLLLAARRKDDRSTNTLLQELEDYALTKS
jgi:two-component system, sensor histidine kinase and response regulator